MDCPSCANLTPTRLGVVHYETPESGWPPSLELFKCGRCALLFLDHRITRSALIDAYAELPADAWADIPRRRDFDLARAEIMRRCQRGDVLDVGCFRGDFLRSLPPEFERFGIEPSRAARKEAERRNIQIVGSSVEDAVIHKRFDVIVLMDVIEHVDAPTEVIKKLAGWLAPNGHLIISTGNAAALPWRMMRLDYWYYVPQHICFFSPRWFEWVAGKWSLKLVAARKFSHSRSAYGKSFVAERWKDFLRCGLFWASRCVGLRWPQRRAPGTPTWPDHLLVVLQAPKNSGSGI